MRKLASVPLVLFLPVWSWAQETSPTLLSDYMARGVFMLWLVGILVVVLLAGAILIVNFAFAAKRPQDRPVLMTRRPGDQGILKSHVYPEEPYEAWALPAEEPPEEEEKAPGIPRIPRAPKKRPA